MTPTLVYYVPTDAPTLAGVDLPGLGLGHARPPGQPPHRRTDAGPGEAGGGIVLAAAGSPAYRPDAQQWEPGPAGEDGRPRWWVGTDRAARPGPKELARPKQIDGHPVRLRDGREWIVPVARSIVRGSTLPKRLVLGPDRQTWSEAELPEYLALCGEAEWVWEQFASAYEAGDSISLDIQRGMTIAIMALAVNYRVGPIEAALLDLFGTDEAFAVLDALVDGPELKRMGEAAKKNEPAPGS